MLLRSPRVALVLALAASTGCSASHHLLRKAPPTPLGDAASVTIWEGLARADFLHSLAGWITTFEDQSEPCPRVERDGAVAVVTGGCTDGSGSMHTGRARMVTKDGVVRARLHEFGDEDTRISGTVRVEAEGERRFALDLRVDSTAPMKDLAPGATWLVIDAHGHRDATGRWQVEGEIAAEGRGRARIRGTDIELDDDRCTHEPLSGRTELWSGDHYVEIRYDGATDCDAARTAKWWRDGVEQGELEGIGGAGCSVGSRSGLGPQGGVLLLLSLIGLRRRRRRRGR